MYGSTYGSIYGSIPPPHIVLPYTLPYMLPYMLPYTLPYVFSHLWKHIISPCALPGSLGLWPLASFRLLPAPPLRSPPDPGVAATKTNTSPSLAVPFVRLA